MIQFNFSLRAALVLACMVSLPFAATAGCSREINVPMSETGLSVVVINDKVVGGIYPELLNTLGEQSRCTFSVKAVPRARLEYLFVQGQADLLIPAVRNPARDAVGLFVPMTRSRATLISVASDRKALTTAQSLLDRPDLKVALVRGFGYGPAYDLLVKQLEEQGRVLYESDPKLVAKLLNMGVAQITIMAPSILAGAALANDELRDLAGRLRYEPIDELPWVDNGAYISKTSLSGNDQKELKALLDRAARSGVVWRGFQKYYPTNVLSESIRPL
jgi:polar amino acid transport system substrate-binding protein